ncbi:MAG: hypothetical protein ABI666_12035 [Ferruginibacter sp.]
MRSSLKIILLLLFFICAADQLTAQLIISGTVYDSSKINPVENVKVESIGGKFTWTDSTGHYKIPVTERDSLTFIYQNKPTLKFAVKDISDPSRFDISLRVTIKSKYRTLKEVIVFARSYREDSIENRQTYGDIYNFRNPTIRTGVSPDGAVGADINEIINIFRFKRNKRLKAFQARLEKQEQEKFVSYRFNKNFVKRITQLQGAELDTFMVRYLPTYEFASTADEITFNKYILNASYRFKIEMLKQDAKK